MLQYEKNVLHCNRVLSAEVSKQTGLAEQQFLTPDLREHINPRGSTPTMKERNFAYGILDSVTSANSYLK